MEEEPKAPVAPAAASEPEAPKAPAAEPIIDNRREEVEKLVQAVNEAAPEAPAVPEPKQETPSEDPLERIKKSVQKRIDKVVAQKKSAEEELAEAKAEIERLRAEKAVPKLSEAVSKEGETPSPEQVEAYILKMREEGNHKEEIAATRYLIKLEKELALKSVREEQSRAQAEAKAKSDKQLGDWANLQRDYIAYDEAGVPDPKSDLNLSNQNGLLYKTALSLYNDKGLHASFYNDPDVIQGFRRAVADAYREIHQQGLITPKGQAVPRTARVALAEPGAEFVEETQTAAVLSDAEKVREEIIARNQNRFRR